LLAFTQRPCESVGDAERAAVAQHLNGCPDCAAIAQGERVLDVTLAQVMRDVPAPAELKPKVLKRLAASRGVGRWKGAAALAAAAALLLAVGVGWHHWSRPYIASDDLTAIVVHDIWNKDQADQYLTEHGLTVSLPTDFNYQYVQTVAVVEFKGRRVAQLGFARTDEQRASATVLILPHNQFRTGNIVDTAVAGWEVAVRSQDDCTYLIFFRGQLDWLRPIRA
jgi:hypothetical protein